MRTRTLWARTERIAFTVWLAASTGACTGWQTVEVSPEQLITEQHPGKLRVTRQDGSRVELEHPSITADTLLGIVRPTTVATRESTGHGDFSTVSRTVGADTAVKVAIPVADAVRIEKRHVSAGKTAGLVFGLLVVGALVAGAIALASWSGPL